jgi:hypothetical protein
MVVLGQYVQHAYAADLLDTCDVQVGSYWRDRPMPLPGTLGL